MHYVVTGTGYTGRRVLEALPGAIAVSRRRQAGFSDHEYRLRDLDADTIEAVDLPAPYTLLYTVPPAPETGADRRLDRLLASLVVPPARIVYLSTSGVYGDRRGEWVDEATRPAPCQPRSERRLRAEQQLQDYCDSTAAELVILRVPGIYGPGRLGIEQIRAGQPVLREADANPGNRIHVDDLAACCIKAMRPGSPPGIYNVGDGDYRSSTRFTACVARIAGFDAPPEVSRSTAEQTFTPGRLSFLQESRRLDVTRMREVLGFEPLYGDPEAGIRASLAEDGLLQDAS